MGLGGIPKPELIVVSGDLIRGAALDALEPDTIVEAQYREVGELLERLGVCRIGRTERRRSAGAVSGVTIGCMNPCCHRLLNWATRCHRHDHMDVAGTNSRRKNGLLIQCQIGLCNGSTWFADFG